MKRKSKYQRRHQKSRDCRDCRNFVGFISKHYFVCSAEMFEDQRRPKCHDIYDTDVLTKGTCNLFVPVETRDLDDVVPINPTMERSIEEDDQPLSDEE